MKEVLTAGLGYLNSELGVDLGLKPELYSPWVILSTACLGLLVIVVVWGFLCRSIFRGKARSTRTIQSTTAEPVKPTVKAAKPEDQKKKSKKKPSEKVMHLQKHAHFRNLGCGL